MILTLAHTPTTLASHSQQAHLPWHNALRTRLEHSHFRRNSYLARVWVQAAAVVLGCSGRQLRQGACEHPAETGHWWSRNRMCGCSTRWPEPSDRGVHCRRLPQVISAKNCGSRVYIEQCNLEAPLLPHPHPLTTLIVTTPTPLPPFFPPSSRSSTPFSSVCPYVIISLIRL